MSEPKGFFGNIFESSDEDPLLQSGPSSSRETSEETSSEEHEGLFSKSSARSFSSEGDASQARSDRASRESGQALHDTGGSDDDQRFITLTEAHDPWADCTTWEGLDALNDAVQTGWHVVDIERQRRADDDSKWTLTLTLERDIPRSLFDFTSP